MHYNWDSALETGHELIDNQHKQLFAKLNSLVDAYNDNKGKAELEKTLEFLAAYTIKHFNDEETLQVKYDYPDYLRHKTIHTDFKNKVTDMVGQLKQNGYDDKLMQETIVVVADWLLNHIKGDDFRMAAYVKAHSDI
ncbi:MAG: hemerythrin family protein [Elusimicrobiota bacterium]|jgi:hemerythrin|nr:hemerythrin family protein [Elusimicrobiota bacterium]